MKRACPSKHQQLRVHKTAERPHSDLLVAYLAVARTATERALRAANCPDVLHLVRTAENNLAAAHDLVRTDRDWAA